MKYQTIKSCWKLFLSGTNSIFRVMRSLTSWKAQDDPQHKGKTKGKKKTLAKESKQQILTCQHVKMILFFSLTILIVMHWCVMGIWSPAHVLGWWMKWAQHASRFAFFFLIEWLKSLFSESIPISLSNWSKQVHKNPKNMIIMKNTWLSFAPFCFSLQLVKASAKESILRI